MSKKLTRANETHDVLMVIPGLAPGKALAISLAFKNNTEQYQKDLGKALHVPWEKKTKPWRDAMRAYVLVHLLLEQLNNNNNPLDHVVRRGVALREQNEHRTALALEIDTQAAVSGFKFKTLVDKTWQQEAFNALQKIYKRWGKLIPSDRLMRPFQGNELGNTIKVIDSDYLWRTELSTMTSKFQGDANAITGQTSSKGDQDWPRSIALHSRHYTFGTLVHELLHFYCHDKFWSKFRGSGTAAEEAKLDEGITEYLTREVLPKADRANHYPLEVLDVQAFLGIGQFTRDDLIAAYFTGDEGAIGKITTPSKGTKKAFRKGGFGL